MKKLISIVTPTFNEELNIERLCKSVSNEMSNLNYDYEHIIIDNNSTDKTIMILRKIASNDGKIKVILNTRNFGHLKSPVHGLLQSSGAAVILMSADFQDPPEMISKYIAEWENGYEVVLGQKDTSEENFFKNFIKKKFYKFIQLISEVPLMVNTTGAGIFDKKIIQEIKTINDPYPYFRGLLSEITSNIKLIKFHQPSRSEGKTKNNFYSLYDIGILGLTFLLVCLALMLRPFFLAFKHRAYLPIFLTLPSVFAGGFIIQILFIEALAKPPFYILLGCSLCLLYQQQLFIRQHVMSDSNRSKS